MDDWSLLPSRNAVSEPAPNPQSPMTTTTFPARLTRPRQAPPAGADHPRPHRTALDPARLARQPLNQSGAEPRNPSKYTTFTIHSDHPGTRTQKIPQPPLDNTRPFMDDTGRLKRLQAGDWPAPSTVIDRYGSWAAALADAFGGA